MRLCENQDNICTQNIVRGRNLVVPSSSLGRKVHTNRPPQIGASTKLHILPEERMRAVAHTPQLLSCRNGGWAGVPIVAALSGAYPHLSPSGSGGEIFHMMIGR